MIGGFSARNEPNSAKIANDRRTGLMLNANTKQAKSAAGINDRIVQVIVEKLGYTFSEVQQQVHNAIHTTGHAEHINASFVANLYFRLLQEEMVKAQRSASNNPCSTSATTFQQLKSHESLGYLSHTNPHAQGIQASFVPSLKSTGSNGMLGQSNSQLNLAKANSFVNLGLSNTQPLVLSNLDSSDNSQNNKYYR
mgnify:CR=1 FL=1